MNIPESTSPKWLIERMEILALRPIPSIEKVRVQWKTSEEFRWKYITEKKPSHVK